jgi:tetratricopeptide (TPR) repeat protein
MLETILGSVLSVASLVAMVGAIRGAYVWCKRRRALATINAGSLRVTRPPGLTKAIVERKHEYAALLEALANRNLIVVTGIAGVGKTTFAQSVAEQLALGDKNRLVWVTCQRRMSLRGFLEKLAWHIKTGYGESDLKEMLEDRHIADATEWLNGLANIVDQKEYVFFFDDFHLAADHPTAHRLVATLASVSKVVILSRELTTGLGRMLAPESTLGSAMQLRGLSEDRALRLLLNEGLTGLDEAALRELCRRVDGHPQALEICAGLLRADQLRLEELLNLPIYEGATERMLEELFRETDKRLTRRERLLLTKCAAFDESFDEEALQHVFPVHDWRPLVRRLEDKALIDRKDGSFSLHPLTQDYFYRRLHDREVCHRRIGEYYLELSGDGHERVNVENRLNAYAHFFRGADYVRAARVVSSVADSMYGWGRHDELLELIEEITPRVARPDPWLHVYKARVVAMRGQLGEARKTLKMMMRRYDSDIAIIARHYLADLYVAAGQYDEAVDLHRLNLSESEELGNLVWATVACYSLGVIHAIKGDEGRASAYYERTVALLSDLRSEEAPTTMGGREDEIGLFTLYTLGRIRHRQGDLGSARRYYRQALTLSRGTGDCRNTCTILRHMADVCIALAQQGRAESLLTASLKVAGEAGDNLIMAQCVHALGDFHYYSMRDHQRAKEDYTRSMELSQPIGDLRSSALSLQGLARIAEKETHFDQAHDLMSAACRAFKEVGAIPELVEAQSDLRRIEEKHLGKDDVRLLSDHLSP